MPVASQFKPMGILANTVGSRRPSRLLGTIWVRPVKVVVDEQQVKLPVLQLWPGGGGGGGQRGVTAAVTLPAKVMAAMKEARVLEKSIVKGAEMRM